ncbi:YdiY family protein [Ningiella sp. W23]|uniref:DUF481 domain-containing protein n=1 Tax=Ningiella sp. W23 TaxID=3023715 RepID=UPI003757FAC5
MKVLVLFVILILAHGCFADERESASQVQELHKKKASDFFRNPHRKRNLIKLLTVKPEQLFAGEEENFPSFELDGEFGFLVTTGNTNTSMLKAAFEADHELEHWSNQYSLQVLTRSTRVDEEDADDIETNRLLFSAQIDYKLSTPTNRLFLFAQYDDNQFLRLRDQLTAVMGWSQLALKKDHTSFRYSLGPGWTRSTRDDTGLIIEEMIVRATANYAYRFQNDTRFRQSISAEVGELFTNARSQTSISAKIFERFAMKLSFEMAVDENVSRNIDRFTTQTSISMVYQFF